MSDDSMSGSGNANSAGANAGKTSQAFNRDQDLAQQVAGLSPAGKEKVKLVQELGEQRLEQERRQQQRSHAFRVMREKVELLRNYIHDQALRPAGARQDPTQDLVIIDEQAERMVQEREAFYLRTIDREVDSNIRQIVSGERRGQGSERSHDHEAER